MLLTDLLREKEELFKEEMILIEAEIDLKNAIAASSKIQNFNDKINKIYSIYISNLIKNKHFRDNYWSDKTAFNKFSSGEYPELEKNKVLYDRYWEDNKEKIINSFENKYKDSSVIRIPNLFKKVTVPSVEKKPVEIVKPIENKKPVIKKKEGNSDIILRIFHQYIKQTDKVGWLKKEIDVDYAATRELQIPKSDFTITIGSEDYGFAVESKASTTSYNSKMSSTIKYSEAFSPKSILKKLKPEEVDEFGSFFSILKSTFIDKIISLSQQALNNASHNHLLSDSKTEVKELYFYKIKDLTIKKSFGPKQSSEDNKLFHSWETKINLSKDSDHPVKVEGIVLNKIFDNYSKEYSPGKKGTNGGLAMERALKKSNNLLFGYLSKEKKLVPGKIENTVSKIEYKIFFKNENLIKEDQVNSSGKSLIATVDLSLELSSVNETKKSNIIPVDFKSGKIAASVNTIKEERALKSFKELILLKENYDV